LRCTWIPLFEFETSKLYTRRKILNLPEGDAWAKQGSRVYKGSISCVSESKIQDCSIVSG
jgi:hypothetical protein